MWTAKEAEEHWKGIARLHKEENERLMKGIDHAIFCLANEDVSEEYVVNSIRMELVKLYSGGELNGQFNKF